MKTDDLIHSLSSELDTDSNPHFYRTSATWWALGTTALLALFFYLIPLRSDFSSKLQSPAFDLNILLSFLFFAFSTFVVYRSSVPGLLSSWEKNGGWVFIGGLFLFFMVQMSTQNLSAELRGEMDFYRGRCGPILLIVGLLQGGISAMWVRKAAPVQPVQTGVWMGLSAGALGLFTMPFICAHENFLHMVIWHAFPVSLLAMVGAGVGRRLFRW